MSKYLVMKFGGSSLADAFKIKKVANLVVDKKRRGLLPIVVVSAMGDTTDDLLKLAYQITATPLGRELDMLLTAGERISMAILAMAINELGEAAVSFTGSQIGIITDNRFNQARIVEIRPFRLQEALEQDKIPIIAGFQGVSSEKEVTTLGRGGSDLTAVALSVALNRVPCHIYTDVDGVYTIDPRLLKNAKRIEIISYEEMLEFSYAGAYVIHPRAVALAATQELPLFVTSSLVEGKGTMVTTKEKEILESPRVKGISVENCVIFKGKKEERDPLGKLSNEGIIPLVFNEEKQQVTLVVFAREKSFVERILPNNFRQENVLMVSLVGFGVGNSPEILKDFLSVLGKKVLLLTISDLRITGFVPKGEKEEILKALGEKFSLLV